MKETKNFEQKYEIDTEIRTLAGKNIENGYVTANTFGTISSFNNKENTYKVKIASIDGKNIEVEYKENEIVLKNLSVNKGNELIDERKAKIAKLSKFNKMLAIIGCIAVLLMLIAGIVVMYTVKDSTAMIIIFISLMVCVICVGLLMLFETNKNNKKILKYTKQIETIALSKTKETNIEKE